VCVCVCVCVFVFLSSSDHIINRSVSVLSQMEKTIVAQVERPSFCVRGEDRTQYLLASRSLSLCQVCYPAFSTS
jgi:hypothetical protein